MPGPVVFSVEDVLGFFQAIEAGGEALEAQRDRAIETFGLVTAEGNCQRLVDALTERGVQLMAGASP